MALPQVLNTLHLCHQIELSLGNVRNGVVFLYFFDLFLLHCVLSFAHEHSLKQLVGLVFQIDGEYLF